MAPSNTPTINGQLNANESGTGTTTMSTSTKCRVTVVGSGNWGSVASKLIASNTLNLPSFHDEVRMWVYEEKLPSGEKLPRSGVGVATA